MFRVLMKWNKKYIFFILVDVEYLKLADTDCSGYGSFDDFEAAQSACNHDSSCGGVRDHNCDENGDDFQLCEYGTNYGWGGDCVHNKKGKYTNHNFFLLNTNV